jgi:aryl-alcohol dehydrogenase-like predicted oxidoreductase
MVTQRKLLGNSSSRSAFIFIASVPRFAKLGTAVQFNIPRHKVIILTKCYNVVHEDPGVMGFLDPSVPGSREYVNQYGLSRAAIFNAVDASLERLQTNYIDLLQIHRFDFNTPIEETMKALHDLVQSGKVRHIGASSMRAWQFADMNAIAEKNGWTKFVSMQDEYSLLYREEVSAHRTWFWLQNITYRCVRNAK